MTKNWPAVVLAALLGLAGLIYLIPQTRAAANDLIYYSKCDNPIKYKIGTIDARFGLTNDEALANILSAENIWEQKAGKNLFQNSNDGDFTINFVYDQRQALSSKVNQLNNQVSQKNAELKAKIDQYKQDSADFERRLNEFVNTVNQKNAQGGVNEEEYNNLINQQNQLKAEAESLNARARELNISTKDYNADVAVLNQDINEFNNVLERKPEEGLFDGKTNTISIYFADKQDELIHTLAHEFGHALGMDHVNEQNAVMFSLTSSTKEATPQDLQELETACRKHPLPYFWVYDLNRWIYNGIEKLQK